MTRLRRTLRVAAAGVFLTAGLGRAVLPLVLELAAFAAFIVAGFLLAPFVGFAVAGVVLLLTGAALEHARKDGDA